MSSTWLALRRRAVIGPFVASAIVWSGTGLAADPTKLQCLDADTKAQEFRRDGKLGAARDQLGICVNAACPAQVRDDCAQRLDDVDRAQPTIVFEVKDGAGRDLVNVHASMGGQPWAGRLDGSASPVDPGPHTFTFEAEGLPPFTEQLVLHEGEKGRQERITIGPPAPAEPLTPAAPPATAPGAAAPDTPGANASGTPAAAAPGPAAPTTSPATSAGAAPTTSPATSAGAAPAAAAAAPRESHGSALPAVGIVLGSLGLAGILVGTISGAISEGAWATAKTLCSPTNCPSATRQQAQSDHDTASSAAMISTVGFVAGGALIATGITLLVVGRVSQHQETHAVSIMPQLSANGGGALLMGRF